MSSECRIEAIYWQRGENDPNPTPIWHCTRCQGKEARNEGDAQPATLMQCPMGTPA